MQLQPSLKNAYQKEYSSVIIIRVYDSLLNVYITCDLTGPEEGCLNKQPCMDKQCYCMPTTVTIDYNAFIQISKLVIVCELSLLSLLLCFHVVSYYDTYINW